MCERQRERENVCESVRVCDMASEKFFDGTPADFPMVLINIIDEYLFSPEDLKTIAKYCIHKPESCNFLDVKCPVIVVFASHIYNRADNLDRLESHLFYDERDPSTKSVSATSASKASEPEDNAITREKLVPLREYYRKYIVLRIHERITHDDANIVRIFLGRGASQIRTIVVTSTDMRRICSEENKHAICNMFELVLLRQLNLLSGVQNILFDNNHAGFLFSSVRPITRRLLTSVLECVLMNLPGYTHKSLDLPREWRQFITWLVLPAHVESDICGEYPNLHGVRLVSRDVPSPTSLLFSQHSVAVMEKVAALGLFNVNVDRVPRPAYLRGWRAFALPNLKILILTEWPWPFAKGCRALFPNGLILISHGFPRDLWHSREDYYSRVLKQKESDMRDATPTTVLSDSLVFPRMSVSSLEPCHSPSSRTSSMSTTSCETSALTTTSSSISVARLSLLNCGTNDARCSSPTTARVVREEPQTDKSSSDCRLQ